VGRSLSGGATSNSSPTEVKLLSTPCNVDAADHLRTDNRGNGLLEEPVDGLVGGPRSSSYLPVNMPVMFRNQAYSHIVITYWGGVAIVGAMVVLAYASLTERIILEVRLGSPLRDGLSAGGVSRSSEAHERYQGQRCSESSEIAGEEMEAVRSGRILTGAQTL
jgi:hypothetical protein